MPYLDSKNLTMISATEDRIYEDYKRLIEQYTDKFNAYGCDILLRKSWHYDGDDTIYYERIPIKRGYSSWIFCDIINNNGVIVESDDHDVYMSAEWGMLGYDSKRHIKEKVFVVYDELDEEEVKEELEFNLDNMEFCGYRRQDDT